MALQPGTSAPNFTLKRKTDDGLAEVSLADHKGKNNVVLLFVPLAFTSVCTEELCGVTQNLDAYDSLQAVVYGISVDSPFAQEAWAKANQIKTPLLSDFNREVNKAYDVQYPDLLGLQGVAKRSAFVINKEGNIVYSWSHDDPHELPPFDQIKAALEKA